jgi:threonine dehydrogenase-like Zn-dependent dehydrogenase
MKIDWPSCFQKEADPMCPQCEKGNYLLCEKQGGEGLPLNQGAGFSDFMVAHTSQLIKIGDDIPDEDAILMEPTACSVRAALKRLPEPGERVLIVGAGAIGLNLLAVLRALVPDAEVYIVSRYPHQTKLAEKLGAAGVLQGKDTYREVADITGGTLFDAPFGNRMIIGGFDVVYDTVGNDKTLADSLRWVRGEGTVVLVGINFAPKRLDYSPVWFQEVEVKGIDCHGMETFRGEQMSSFDVALTLYREGALDFSGFITHTFPMKDYKKAIDVFFNKGKNKTVKVVLSHE